MRLDPARKPLDRIAPILLAGLFLVPVAGASRRNVFFSGFPPGSVISCDGLVLGTIRGDGSTFSLFVPEGNPTFRVELNGKVIQERAFLIEKGKTLYLTPGKTVPVPEGRPAPVPSTRPPETTAPAAVRPPAASAPAPVRPPGTPAAAPAPASPRTPSVVVTATPGTPLPAPPAAAPGKPGGKGVAETLEETASSSLPLALALSVLVMAFVGVWGWRRIRRTPPVLGPADGTAAVPPEAPAEADDAPVAEVFVEEAAPAGIGPFGKGPKPDFIEDLHLRETQATLGIRRPKAGTNPPFILDIQDFKIRDDS